MDAGGGGLRERIRRLYAGRRRRHALGHDGRDREPQLTAAYRVSIVSGLGGSTTLEGSEWLAANATANFTATPVSADAFGGWTGRRRAYPARRHRGRHRRRVNHRDGELLPAAFEPIQRDVRRIGDPVGRLVDRGPRRLRLRLERLHFDGLEPVVVRRWHRGSVPGVGPDRLQHQRRCDAVQFRSTRPRNSARTAARSSRSRSPPSTR